MGSLFFSSRWITPMDGNLMKKNKLAIALLSIWFSANLCAGDKFDQLDFEVKQRYQSKDANYQEFYDYVNVYLDEYEVWRDEYTQQVDSQKAELIAQWGEGAISDNTTQVDYSDDSRTRTIVDYEKNTATVSVLVDADETAEEAFEQIKVNQLEIDGRQLNLDKKDSSVEPVLYSHGNERKEREFIVKQTQAQMNDIDVRAERLIRSQTGIPNSFIYQRAHNQKMTLLTQAKKRVDALSALYKSMRAKHGIAELEQTSEIKVAKSVSTPKEPKLDGVMNYSAEEVIAEKELETLMKTEEGVITDTVQSTKRSDTQQVTVNSKVNLEHAVASVPKKVVSYKIKLPENSLKSRAKQFKSLAEKESEMWQVDPALVMAIMHSESSFRPKAKSHIPAFGLMQIVPSSAGHDVNKQVRKIDAPMKSAELYIPEVNVETGTAYLNILDTRYLKKVKDDRSRLYCVIAAYNTGAGNVAKAFNTDRSTSINQAAKIINSMSSDEVYAHLIHNLPYDETKNYLKKVNGRISLYR